MVINNNNKSKINNVAFYGYVLIISSLTFVVDLEADGADALVRLQVEPHLVGHAHDQVWNEAAREAGVCT